MEVTGYDLRQTKQEAERAIDRAVSDLRYDLERKIAELDRAIRELQRQRIGY